MEPQLLTHNKKMLPSRFLLKINKNKMILRELILNKDNPKIKGINILKNNLINLKRNFKKKYKKRQRLNLFKKPIKNQSSPLVRNLIDLLVKKFRKSHTLKLVNSLIEEVIYSFLFEIFFWKLLLNIRIWLTSWIKLKIRN